MFDFSHIHLCDIWSSFSLLAYFFFFLFYGILNGVRLIFRTIKLRFNNELISYFIQLKQFYLLSCLLSRIYCLIGKFTCIFLLYVHTWINLMYVQHIEFLSFHWQDLNVTDFFTYTLHSFSFCVCSSCSYFIWSFVFKKFSSLLCLNWGRLWIMSVENFIFGTLATIKIRRRKPKWGTWYYV